MDSTVLDKDTLENEVKAIFKQVEDSLIKRTVNQLEIEKEFQEVWDYALQRFRFGSIEYGEWNPDVDKRDVLEEVKEEIGDVVIYAGMLMIKINRLMKRLESIGLRNNGK